jgi:hypothetical protein
MNQAKFIKKLKYSTMAKLILRKKFLSKMELNLRSKSLIRLNDKLEPISDLVKMALVVSIKTLVYL